MKRIKLILIGSAIVLSLGTAWATKPSCAACVNFQQYYYSGGQYFPTGDYGFDYYCFTEYQLVCTYYRPNPIFQPNYYVPCRAGLYSSEFANK